MNVVYSTSDSYAFLAGISLHSLLEKNKEAESIQIYIIDNAISDQNKSKMTATAKQFGRTIKFVPIPDIEAMAGEKIDTGKWNISSIGRLFDAMTIPEADKVIHIDCDMVICDSLAEIWDMDMSHACVAGALEVFSDLYKTNIGMKPEEDYLNGGILVFNLKRIRELELEKKFLEYMRGKGESLEYLDQEVLNSCVPQEEKRVFPLRYNAYSYLFYFDYHNLFVARRARQIISEQEYDEARNHPAIIHYAACFMDGTRPWMEGNRHPLKETFLAVKRASQWRDVPLAEQAMSLKKRVISILVRILPVGLAAWIAGFLHGYLVPTLDAHKRGKNRKAALLNEAR